MGHRDGRSHIQRVDATSDVGARLARLALNQKSCRSLNRRVAGDPTSKLWQYPTVNGYSGQGDVTAEVVYVNYGLIEDYAQLDSMGISVKGRRSPLPGTVDRFAASRRVKARRSTVRLDCSSTAIRRTTRIRRW